MSEVPLYAHPGYTRHIGSCVCVCPCKEGVFSPRIHAGNWQLEQEELESQESVRRRHEKETVTHFLSQHACLS